MQLILAADVSGSVNPARYKTQQDGYLEALGDSRVLNVIAELDPPVLAIAFVAWAREQVGHGAVDAGPRCQIDGIIPKSIATDTTSADRH